MPLFPTKANKLAPFDVVTFTHGNRSLAKVAKIAALALAVADNQGIAGDQALVLGQQPEIGRLPGPAIRQAIAHQQYLSRRRGNDGLLPGEGSSLRKPEWAKS